MLTGLFIMGIPRIWKDSFNNKAVIVLFSEMADWQTQFSKADTLWHKRESGKGRRWLPKRKQQALMSLLNIGIKKLTTKQGESLYLYFYKNKTERDIAKILGISRQAVSKRIKNGITKIRKFLGVDRLQIGCRNEL